MGTLEADAFRGGKKRSKFQFVIQDLDSPLFDSADAAGASGDRAVDAEKNPQRPAVIASS